MFSSRRISTQPSLDTVLSTSDQDLENFTTLIPPEKGSKPHIKFCSPHIQENKLVDQEKL
jgi:hypothetical protein